MDVTFVDEQIVLDALAEIRAPTKSDTNWYAAKSPRDFSRTGKKVQRGEKN
jgi:hypothetical protein